MTTLKSLEKDIKAILKYLNIKKENGEYYREEKVNWCPKCGLEDPFYYVGVSEFQNTTYFYCQKCNSLLKTKIKKVKIE